MVIQQEHFQIMMEHVQSIYPEEACGLLGGIKNRSEVVIKVPNQLHSPVRFFMNPVELFEALTYLEQNQLELMGVYHSHPTGPATPSQTDLNEFYYPDTKMLIWSFENKLWQLKAFIIENHHFQEININLVS